MNAPPASPVCTSGKKEDPVKKHSEKLISRELSHLLLDCRAALTIEMDEDNHGKGCSSLLKLVPLSPCAGCGGERMNGWMGGLMDGWMDGWIDGFT